MDEKDRNLDKSSTTSSNGRDGPRNTTLGSEMRKWVMRKKQSKNTRNMPEEDLNSSRDACFNEGVML